MKALQNIEEMNVNVGPLVILGIVIDGHYRTMTLDQEE